MFNIQFTDSVGILLTYTFENLKTSVFIVIIFFYQTIKEIRIRIYIYMINH